MPWLLALALLLALGGLLLWLFGRRQRISSGLPAGEVVYADTGAWQRNERPLFSRRYGLSGKPDYLVEERGRFVPVEVKPGRTAATPYDGDILQLAAYCLLAEEEYGQSPPYGYLKYRRQLFRIEYTAGLRRRLLSTLEDMRHAFQARDLPPGHTDPHRCLHCGHHDHCARRLA